MLVQPARAQSDDCRIVIASRNTLSEAQAFARSTSADLPTLIYKAPNGFYAIATFSKRGLTGPESLRFLKSNGDIPNDSFCTKPAGFKFIATGESSNSMSDIIADILAWLANLTIGAWIGIGVVALLVLFGRTMSSDDGSDISDDKNRGSDKPLKAIPTTRNKIPPRQTRPKPAGGVTVDWIVLTCAVVGLGVAIVASLPNDNAGSQGSAKAPPPAKKPASNVQAASQQADDYDLTMCNRSNKKVFLILDRRIETDDEKSTLKGWYSLQPGGCDTYRGAFGRYSDGLIYFYAHQEGRKTTWNGDKSGKVCAPRIKFSRYLDDPDYTCRPDEDLFDTGYIRIPRAEPRYTLTLNGP